MSLYVQPPAQQWEYMIRKHSTAQLQMFPAPTAQSANREVLITSSSLVMLCAQEGKMISERRDCGFSIDNRNTERFLPSCRLLPGLLAANPGKNEDVFPETGAFNQAATWVSRSVSHRDALGCWLPRWCRLRKVTGPRCESADRSSLFHKLSHTEHLQSHRHWQHGGWRACLPSVIRRFRDNIHIISAEMTCQVIDNQTRCWSESIMVFVSS